MSYIIYVILVVFVNSFGWVKLHLFLLFSVNFAQILKKLRSSYNVYLCMYVLYMSNRYFSIELFAVQVCYSLELPTNRAK